MNGELAMMVCLATHGRAWLARPDRGAAPPLDRINSTFQFVGSLRFQLAGDEPNSPGSVAQDVATWLTQLADRDADGLWLLIPEAGSVMVGDRQVDEHALIGFTNSGRWSLLASRYGAGESWRANWQVGDREAPDRRIWSVSYEGTRTGSGSAPRTSLTEASSNLDAALQDALEFASHHDLDFWAQWFAKALSAGDEIPYHPDLLPADWPAGARTLMAKACQAEVFGGMGSWNDVHLHGDIHEDADEQYRTVSRALYGAVLAAIMASANSDLTTWG